MSVGRRGGEQRRGLRSQSQRLLQIGTATFGAASAPAAVATTVAMLVAAGGGNARALDAWTTGPLCARD